MKYFLDTEFFEHPTRIELISLGLVCEDGRELYMESTDFEWNRVPEGHWVQDNVRPHLVQDMAVEFPREKMADLVLRFTFGYGDESPEFWGYYADYDWVAFCWLFGPMAELPKGFPMYCRDLKQWSDALGSPEHPPQDGTEHNAVEDARWNMELYNFLARYERKQVKRALHALGHEAYNSDIDTVLTTLTGRT